MAYVCVKTYFDSTRKTVHTRLNKVNFVPPAHAGLVCQKFKLNLVEYRLAS